MLLWWRRIDELLGLATGQLMRKLVSSLNKRVNEHFDDPEAAEDIIRIVFIEYGQLMEYGKNVHDGIRAERCAGPRQPERVARATRAALELIKNPASTDNGDINAVIPLVSFYAGFVVTFGRAAGFNSAVAEVGVTAVVGSKINYV
jgi:hypothetical protein